MKLEAATIAAGQMSNKRPICARCKKPVDSMMSHNDGISGVTTIMVHCHGKSESVQIPDRLWIDANPDTIQFGECFREQKVIP